MLPPRRIGRDSGLETTRFLARLKAGRNVGTLFRRFPSNFVKTHEGSRRSVLILACLICPNTGSTVCFAVGTNRQSEVSGFRGPAPSRKIRFPFFVRQDEAVRALQFAFMQ